ncbi:hypothetical protein [Basfia succiniciproducens]|uniref:Uncharacterized protein n=1 Tax=Basfia succiniciproducens TaxID=653940 RepID=A0A1G5BXT7_9PAST|nr:hypothetical protein [Basfia succiniciproducens]QIM68168.1 hypothetical protein A4G13_01510 [Basfia succiniciproducens]SCX94896.1 hypothetical protein SAMN02910354_00917 [Basfia succiniciproducens]SEQ78279.1 hypothetical protein SAMN02910415_02043 [Basfia succiniciproducens]
MTINFQQILQDSWNFIRNQRKFTLMLTLTFCLVTLILNIFGSSLFQSVTETAINEPIDKNELSTMMQRVQSGNFLLLYVVNQFITLLLSTWGILSIHQISRRQSVDYMQTAKSTLGLIFGVIILNILIALPLMGGLINIIPAAINPAAASAGIIGFALMIFGVYVYVRLCLAPIHYTVSKTNIFASLQQTWQLGNKRTSTLFLYCLLVYFIVPFIAQQVAFLANNTFLNIITTLIISFLSVFTLVVTYRFYILFTQKA